MHCVEKRVFQTHGCEDAIASNCFQTFVALVFVVDGYGDDLVAQRLRHQVGGGGMFHIFPFGKLVEARKSILSLELSRTRLGGRRVGKPCPHGQGWDGWGIRQRGNGLLNLARSVCLSPSKPPSLPRGLKWGLRNGCPRPVLPTSQLGARCAGSQRKRRLKGRDSGCMLALTLTGTWGLRDGLRPASRRKRRLKRRASGGLLARRLKAGRSHYRVFVCRPGGRHRPAAAAGRRTPPERRAGAKRKAAWPSPQGRDPGLIGARFTRDKGFGPR